MIKNKLKDWFKKLKCWQKGFLIGIIIHLLYFLIFIPWIFSDGGETLSGWLFVFTELLVAVTIFPFMNNFIDDFFVLGGLLTGLIVTVIFGLIGAVIGWIIVKIKGKR